MRPHPIGKALSLAALTWLAVTSAACASHRSKVQERFPGTYFEPTQAARVVAGWMSNANQITERMERLHLDPRAYFELAVQLDDMFAAQLGGADYLLIGQLRSGGNEFADQRSLRKAALERAALAGADVLLIVDSGTVVVDSRLDGETWSYTTPGHDTAPTLPRFAGQSPMLEKEPGVIWSTSSGKNETTDFNSRAYSGMGFCPWSCGLLFKHVPGYRAYEDAMLAMPDEQLAVAFERIHAVMGDASSPWNEKWLQVRTIACEASDG